MTEPAGGEAGLLLPGASGMPQGRNQWAPFSRVNGRLGRQSPEGITPLPYEPDCPTWVASGHFAQVPPPRFGPLGGVGRTAAGGRNHRDR